MMMMMRRRRRNNNDIYTLENINNQCSVIRCTKHKTSIETTDAVKTIVITTTALNVC